MMYPFYKDALEKLGIKMNIFYAGSFKSATEPYRMNDMSDANKLQSRVYIDELNDLLVASISKDRNLSESEVKDIIANYDSFDADNSLESGLIDGLMYWDEMETFLKSIR